MQQFNVTSKEGVAAGGTRLIIDDDVSFQYPSTGKQEDSAHMSCALRVQSVSSSILSISLYFFHLLSFHLPLLPFNMSTEGQVGILLSHQKIRG